MQWLLYDRYPHPFRHIVQQLRNNAHRQHDCFEVSVGLGD